MENLIELKDSLDTATFYGVNNQNMITLRDQHPDVRIIARGYTIKVSGPEASVKRFTQNLHRLEEFCIQNNTLTENHILMLIHGEQPTEFVQDNLILHGVNGRSIVARSQNQQNMVEAYEDNDLIFALGPAGSGKTYVAIALAVRALKQKEVKRIILSRPAVEAGEKLGFLPGDMKEKIDPYLQPLYDALRDMIPQQKLLGYWEDNTIEIAPLAFMRGRTLDNAFVILDEAQNATQNQLKMFLTRMGRNAKFVITGDITQIDLPRHQQSGLVQATRILDGIEGISVIQLDNTDVVRHKLVTRIIRAYDRAADKSEPPAEVPNQ